MRPSSSWRASGNPVRVLTGPAAGGTGTVVGKHAFVLVDFPQQTLDLLGPGDRLLVRARGQGLRLLDFPDVALRSCSPELLHALPVQVRGDALAITVAAEIPAFLMGAGIGMSSEWANCDVMLTRPDTVADLGYEAPADRRRRRDDRPGSPVRPRLAAPARARSASSRTVSASSPATGPASSRSCPAPASGSSLETDPAANVGTSLGLPA